MMALRPRFANSSDTRLKMIAQMRYFGPSGKSALNVSAQLVMRPTAVLRHASVTVAASLRFMVKNFLSWRWGKNAPS